jgi:hypothetical protein
MPARPPITSDDVRQGAVLGALFLGVGAVFGLLRGDGVVLGAVAGGIMFGIVVGVGGLLSLLPRR